MTGDLVKYRIPAAFVAARVRLRPSELAYGYVHGWLDAASTVALAVDALAAGRGMSPPLEDLAMLLSEDFDRVAELIAGIDDAPTSPTR